MENEKKYILGYGFRRYAACKKLGWKVIPAVIQDSATGSKVVKDIPLSSIFLGKENTRLDDQSEGFEQLMQSIKQQGLLQPVGVWETENLSTEDFLVVNVIENIHRKDITPYELGLAIRSLKDLGLNDGQIAVRLGVPATRIKTLNDMSARIPMNLLKEVSFLGDDRRNTGGKLSYALVSCIATARIFSGKDMPKLIQWAKKDQWSKADVNKMIILMNNGCTADEAYAKLDDITAINVTFSLDKKRIELLKAKYEIPTNKIIKAMITGEIPIDKSLFVYKTRKVI